MVAFAMTRPWRRRGLFISTRERIRSNGCIALLRLARATVWVMCCGDDSLRAVEEISFNTKCKVLWECSTEDDVKSLDFALFSGSNFRVASRKSITFNSS